MYTPPYAAKARPATSLSTSVRSQAKRANDTMPGAIQNGDWCVRSHAQYEKQPPISAKAAST